MHADLVGKPILAQSDRFTAPLNGGSDRLESGFFLHDGKLSLGYFYGDALICRLLIGLIGGLAVITISSGGESLELPVSAETAAALLAELSTTTARGNPEDVGELVAWRLLLMLRAFAGAGPSTSARPTEPQIKYACDLALKHAIPLPPEVLQSRTAIGTFISGLTLGGGPLRPRRGRGGLSEKD